ncbi:uncharacterized protein LOC112269525 [Brachypodium distachyon]|uniref:Uncharacterized protein n=1 Tax=Brachypodium distachyon TaxID=15368 RepID=A0A0Q3KU40_BRADI|nr:uncharacterized protein LOC112269525 [Brachypodium distachyon]KQJ83741.1 hypothetical protein BRADI_5g16575v3 [Brachypodium distachyon]|eukprot:XP_024312167.1 uncharacterized protein LOC112269525 [Brachypodium distachyon]
MVRDAGGTVLPATLLAMLLLILASELATFSCGHRILRAADVAASKRAPTPTQHSWVSPAAVSAETAGGDAAAAEFGDSKRLVPQGPNPLHN